MPKLPEKKSKPAPKVVYPVLEVLLFHSSPEAMTAWSKGEAESNPLTGEVAKELLGFCTEEELKHQLYMSLPEAKQKEAKSSKNVSIEGISSVLSIGGKPIYCTYNLTNRPFNLQLAEDWKLEILRRKWRFNGETIIKDKYGMLHDGQHRLLGLLLAIEEWKEDGKKPKHLQEWQEIWKEEPFIESLVVLGIEADDETVNTIGTGKRRTLEDVLFRSEFFDGVPAQEKKALAKVTSWAIKLVWDRTSQKDASFAPRRPHSESMDFIARHERILQAVRFIHDESGGNEKFKHFVPLGYAAGLMYLMGAAASDVEKYQATNSEESLDFSLWDKAEEFWIDVATNGKKTEVLRELLLKIPENAGGTYNRDLRCGLCIKAWNAFSDGEKLTEDNVAVEIGENEYQLPIITEAPKIGGIDVDYSPPEKPKKEKEGKATVPKNPGKKSNGPAIESTSYGVPTVEGECPHGGDHDWIEEDGDTFCAKCMEPKTVERKKPKGKK